MIQKKTARPIGFPNAADLQFLPEGIVPIGDDRCSWVAIQHGEDQLTGSLCEFDFRSNTNVRFDLHGRPGFAFRQPDARYLIGMERVLGYFDPRDESWLPFSMVVDEHVENTIINDGIQLGDNLIFGTKDLEFATKKAGLYLYRISDNVLVQLRDDQICSNGKFVLSDDRGLRIYDIDSPTRQIVSYRLDLDAGRIDDHRVEIDLTDHPAVPDGMVATANGESIIVAMFNPDKVSDGETRRYNRATGELECLWTTPGSRQNTCPAIVTIKGKETLVITTAAEFMDDEDRHQCPHAGQFFLGEL